MGNRKAPSEIRAAIRNLTKGDTKLSRVRLIYTALYFSAPFRLEAMIMTRALRIEIEAKQFEQILKRNGFEAEYGVEDVLRYLHTLAEIPWRLAYPYGCWIEKDDAVVVFDRNYFPIVRLSFDAPPEIVDPLERVDFGEQRWFYEDATAPYRDPRTLTVIFLLADLFGINEEIESRQKLSDYGRVDDEVWGEHWKSR